MIALDLSPELSDRLASAAERMGRTQNDLVREAVMDRLDELEDLAAAETALADIRSGRSRTHSLDEVERELGLGD